MSKKSDAEVLSAQKKNTEDVSTLHKPHIKPEKAFLNQNTENPEEVRETLKKLEQEKKQEKSKGKNTPVIKLLMTLFFPVTLIILSIKKLFKKVKLTVSAKTTIVFTVLFGALLSIYIIIIALIFTQHLKNNDDSGSFLVEFYIVSVCLIVVFVIAGSTLGNVVSYAMLSPLRKIIDQIREVNEESLDKRLEPLETKDELSDLTDIINNMLNTLQSSFEQQAYFVSDASHELKTPLSIIQGYANLLQRWGKEDPALVDEGIQTIAREAGNMKKIVEQLLLLAKLGDFTLHYSEVEIMQLVGHTVNSYNILDLTHTINFSRDESTINETDKSLLVEALRTLIDNAIKYTKEDGIIDIRCAAYKDRVEITVSDNGIGISEKDLPHIFVRFYRCDRARREKGSTGLGLTIAKSIVEMMGGRLTVESHLNVGSTFKVILYH